MIRLLHPQAMLLLLLFQFDISVHGQTKSEAHATSVLIATYETVAYTSTVTLNHLESVNHKQETNGLVNLALPFNELLGALQVLGPNVEKQISDSYDSVYVGAKTFTGPKGLGSVNSQKCYVLVAKTGVQPDLTSEFTKATSETLGAKTFWTWVTAAVAGQEESTRYYAAQVSDSFLMISNEPKDIEQLANALESRSEPKIEMNEEGLRQLVAYDYWAYRRFRWNEVNNQDVEGTKKAGREAVDFEFFANLATKQSFVQVSSSDKSMKTIPNILTKTQIIKLQPVKPGQWQAFVPLLSNDQANFDALFEVFYRLGFGVVI